MPTGNGCPWVRRVAHGKQVNHGLWVAVSALALLLFGLIGGAFLTRYEYLPRSAFTTRLDRWTSTRQVWHCGYYEKDAHGRPDFNQSIDADGHPIVFGRPDLSIVDGRSVNIFDQSDPLAGMNGPQPRVYGRVYVCGWFTE